jgi:murein DD-endopeptidase MepM/ murein hydrolase activator NlpD
MSVYPTGSLASAEYDKTVFSIEDWDRATGAAARVKSVLLAKAIATRSAVFTAVGRTTSSPSELQEVTLPIGQSLSAPFGIYRDDFYEPDGLHSEAENGTDKRSGLRWPRIVGLNRGKPFSYSASLPAIVRDLVGDCVPEPHAYYRLPWDTAGVHKVGQANNTPVTLSDPNPSHSPASSQRYAFDFLMPEGTTVRAARGGKVTWLKENHPDAGYDEDAEQTPTNHPWGNGVRIEHEDGTTGWYFHLQKGRVRVEVGEVVERGQPIARSGNSGRSTAPHLHFQVQKDPKSWAQSVRVRFGGKAVSPAKNGCLTPGRGWLVVSDNKHPKFP